MTETGATAELLDPSRRAWPDVTDRRPLLLALTEAGGHALRAQLADPETLPARQQAGRARIADLVDVDRLVGDEPPPILADKLGRKLRLVCEGHQTRAEALDRYGAFSADHAWPYAWLPNAQHAAGRLTDRRLPSAVIGLLGRGRLVDQSFNHYLAIAPPSFARDAGGARPAAPRRDRVPAPAWAGADADAGSVRRRR